MEYNNNLSVYKDWGILITRALDKEFVNALVRLRAKQFFSVIRLIIKDSIGELIYTCKMIQPGIFSRFSQPVHFSRFKPDNLLLSTAGFPGYNLEKYAG